MITIKQRKYCYNCGIKLQKLTNYCMNCGAKLIKKKSSKSSSVKCTICHQPINEEFHAFVNCPYCDNAFHYNCSAEWLAKHNACPLCQNVFVVPKTIKK